MRDAAPERRVVFVCTHNAGRSIVAAALLNARQPPGVTADSAGTEPADALNATVVAAGRHHEPAPHRSDPPRGVDAARALAVGLSR